MSQPPSTPRRLARPSARHLAALLLLCACAEPQDPDSPLWRSTSNPIYGGTADTAPAHMAVVVIDIFNGGGLCSGTLIAPRAVLTAAHCLEDSSRLSDYKVGFGANDRAATWVRVSRLDQHPQYDGYNLLNDIGVIRLASDPPAGVVPIPPLPARLALTSADVGTNVQFSGFGETERGTTGVKLQMWDDIRLVCAGSSSCRINGGIASPRTVCFDQQPGGPCGGDSGGPAFLVRSGQEYVVGVTSYGDTSCDTYGCSTKVDAFESFLSSAIGGAAGSACTTGATCASGACVGGVCCAQACDDGCHTCAAGTGACTPVREGTTCDDHDACTPSSTCVAGACTGANRRTCPARDACHLAGACNASTGACSEPVAPNGTACDDGSRCTSPDKCSGGVCRGTQNVSCVAGPCQKNGRCDPATGGCIFDPAPDGTSCNDQSLCTGGEQCRGGECVAATSVQCSSPDPCQPAMCNATTGMCETGVIADGTACRVDGDEGVCENAYCKKTGCGCASGGEGMLPLALLLLAALRRRS